jgi:hypothetical protein
LMHHEGYAKNDQTPSNGEIRDGRVEVVGPEIDYRADSRR